VTPDPKAKKVCEQVAMLASERNHYEAAWKDIRTLVRPNTEDFQSRTTPGDERTQRTYDSTAILSNVDLANAVHTFLANPSERNFGIKVAVDREFNEDPEVIEWCDTVSDIIALEYADDRSNSHGSLQESLLDLAFGNIIENQEWDGDKGHLSFESCALADCFFKQNSRGLVDTLYKQKQWTVEDIKKEFKEARWDGSDREKPETKYTVIHGVFPRENREYGKNNSTNMPWASCWVLKDKMVVLDEKGYKSFPYHVGRWAKSNEETYGRGPAINCLADIRMLNRMEFTILKQWQMAVAPPIVVPSDGFIGKLRNEPNAIWYKDPSAADFEVQTLEHKGKLEGAENKSEQKREFIRRTFYADWVKLMPKKERQTAYEISELVEQQLRMMAPMLGRLQTEFFIPRIQRSYELLLAAGKFPPAPPQMDGAVIEVDYVSASARAQAATRVLNYQKLIQNVSVLQPFAPDVMDAIDTDAITQDMAILLGVPRRAIRSPEQIIEIRSAKAQQQQMMALAEAAPKVSKAALDFSKANEAGGLL
jgi:hypothetical protein